MNNNYVDGRTPEEIANEPKSVLTYASSMDKDTLKKEARWDGAEAFQRGDTLCVEMLYPRHNEIKHIEVGLCDVRASDGIRITYDFDRDGYVIEQPTQMSWSVDERPDCKWKEVAFVESWALEDEQKANEPK